MTHDPRVDDYLAQLPEVRQAALGRIRAQVHALVPDCRETISYGMPAFIRGDGPERPFLWFADWKRHCSLYPLTDAFLAAHRDALRGFERTKGSLHFTPDAPLPDALIEALVRDRLAAGEPDQIERRP